MLVAWICCKRGSQVYDLIGLEAIRKLPILVSSPL